MDAKTRPWVKVHDMELAHLENRSEMLKEFAPTYAALYDLGVQVPALAVGGQPDQSLEVGAAIHKRALSNYRGVWTMAELGYHSEAATIAAALWEHALAAEGVLTSAANAQHYEAMWTDKTKWQTIDLARFSATARAATTPQERELMAERVHGAYTLLCKIKHPTMASVGFDTGGTWNGEHWSVEAAPDARPEAASLSAWVFSVCIARMLGARYAFAEKAIATGTKKPWEGQFWHQLTSTAAQHDALKSKHGGPLPFGLSTKDLAKYKAIAANGGPKVD